MNGYFMGMHRYLRMRKLLLAKNSSEESSSMTIISKCSKLVLCIHDNKDLERCYFILKIIPPCISFFCLEGSNKSRRGKVYFYSIITDSCSDLDNKDILKLSTSFPNIWNISNSDDEEEERLNIVNTDISDCYM